VPVRTLLFHLGAPKVSLGVSAVHWDTESRILLVHHTYRREGWAFPSGLVRRGEQPGMALLRELREELATDASLDGLLHAEIDARIPHLTLYFAVRLHGTPRHASGEVDDHRYVALEDLESIVGAPPAPWLVQDRSRRA
jgi:8-oxo-dGTP pyrophosphatase MutT (NUDIX family)